jgi:hypothetical protein
MRAVGKVDAEQGRTGAGRLPLPRLSAVGGVEDASKSPDQPTLLRAHETGAVKVLFDIARRKPRGGGSSLGACAARQSGKAKGNSHNAKGKSGRRNSSS